MKEILISLSNSTTFDVCSTSCCVADNSHHITSPGAPQLELEPEPQQTTINSVPLADGNFTGHRQYNNSAQSRTATPSSVSLRSYSQTSSSSSVDLTLSSDNWFVDPHIENGAANSTSPPLLHNDNNGPVAPPLDRQTAPRKLSELFDYFSTFTLADTTGSSLFAPDREGTTGPVGVADVPWFAPPRPSPSLMAVLPPMVPWLLVDVNGGASKVWSSQQHQWPARLDPGPLLNQPYVQPIGSRYHYPQHLTRQPSQRNVIDEHHQAQHQRQTQQQPQQPYFGYFLLQAKGSQEIGTRQTTSCKRRQRLTTEASEFLLGQFEINKKPTTQKLEGFAKHLKLRRKTLQFWFQNRRAKVRRDQRAKHRSNMTPERDEEGEDEMEELEGDN